MTFKLHIDQKKDYLHIKVTGVNSVENVATYLDQIVHECEARNCNRVLIEEHLEGPRLGFADIFKVASESSIKALGKIRALAYVDINAEDDSMLFAELVARNRSMPVRVFKSLVDAESWIANRSTSEQVH